MGFERTYKDWWIFKQVNMTEHISLITDTLTVQDEAAKSFIHYAVWFWISMIQFALLIFLVTIKFRKKPAAITGEAERVIIKEAAGEKVDMHNLMENINKSNSLYKLLSSKCHPDRFINHPKHKLAEEIFQEITLYRRNYKKLCALRERAIIELNVKL
jgi:hypothetical protein